MAIDPARLESLCDAIHANTDPEAEFRDPQGVAALAALVSSDPADALAACVTALKARERGTGWLFEVIEALRTVDVSWFHRALDLLLTEPTLWDAIHETERYTEIADYFGIAVISRAWHDHMRTEDASHWSVDLAWLEVEVWADEERHQTMLLQLIEDADDETIWVTAASSSRRRSTRNSVTHSRDFGLLA